MTAGRDARLLPAGGGPPSEYRHDAGDSREEEPGVGGSRSESGYPALESEACTAPGGLGR